MISETLERIKGGNIAKLRKANGKARVRAKLNIAIKIMIIPFLQSKQRPGNQVVIQLSHSDILL